MDPDSPWEENPDMNHVPEAEWTKIASEFTNAGYREGIIAGKEAFLQAGFDAGFADIGVPLGRELGNLRGVAAAIRAQILSTQSAESVDLEEIRSISSGLSSIRFADIAPRDLEAEQHAKEHLDVDDPAIIENSDSGSEKAPQERPTMEDMAKLKERLASLSTKLGLPVLA
ncbi:hypothetical protein JVT61DRAFT_7140 [Boletus reticuloceps]|uniref:Protein YAE1 n=1 Tax=Boletus reticuloceps TaxID=495285 RepID=A0A8I2YIK1_9AGAM|nr:hypothetical protein JVT61DRAFT_7140 [Boletus reticuloceps]